MIIINLNGYICLSVPQCLKESLNINDGQKSEKRVSFTSCCRIFIECIALPLRSLQNILKVFNSGNFNGVDQYHQLAIQVL